MDETNRTTASSQLAPNRRGLILLLGLVAWLIGIVGLIALGKGLDHLQRIKKGQMDPSGQGMIVCGATLGVLGFIVNVAMLIHQCGK